MTDKNGQQNDGTIVLGARVPIDFVKKVAGVAAKETRTLSNMVYVLLREALKARGVKL
jgi:hypothetical protein